MVYLTSCTSRLPSLASPAYAIVADKPLFT